MPGGEKYSRLSQQAAVALVEYPTIKQAAAAVGCDESTIRAWLREKPEFRALYDAARGELVERALTRLQQIAGAAVDTLQWCLTDGGKDSTKLAAAQTVLNHVL